MGVVFQQGQTLGRGDLDLFLSNSSGNVQNAYTISFALYYVDPTSSAEVLIGPATREPVNPAVGEYYAAVLIPPSAQPGTYHIRWTIQELASSPQQQIVQEFAVVSETTLVTPGISTCKSDLLRKLRMMIRDNAPDKNYKFRPPTGEGTVGCYNQVFGYIWEDEELLEYLEIALWKWNMMPPETEELCNIDTLCQRKPAWRTALLTGAVASAAMALAFNWVADEFSVGASTTVRVFLPDGQAVDLPIMELFEVTRGLDHGTRAALREAFHTGRLMVDAADPATGVVGRHAITDVLQHNTEHKAMVRTTLVDGRSVETTVDHSLFHRVGSGIVPVEAGALRAGDQIATGVGSDVVWVVVKTVERLPPDEHTYDLSVPGPENFVLSNGIMAHNSYSIGGISLDLDKSSKYESLKQSAEDQFDKLAEAKARTTKYMRGLRQSRFGGGMRSNFGPNPGRGQNSPLRFL